MAIDNESIADEFGEKIAQSLRDRAAWRHLPPGFAARFVGAERRSSLPRLKAAAVWLALGLGAFAAVYVGV